MNRKEQSNKKKTVSYAIRTCSIFIFSAIFFFSSTVFCQNNAKTKIGSEFGLRFFNYAYKEPSLNVEDKAPLKIGIDYNFTSSLGTNFFFIGDSHYAAGNTNYSGSGTQKDNPDWYWELRGLFGKDFQIKQLVLAPYIGYGYRYLFNGSRGISSANAIGYNRESRYWYLPLGFSVRSNLGDNWRNVTNIEYDHLINGLQVTHLEDVPGYLLAITNRQTQGYGLTASTMFGQEKFSLGPYIAYWRIKASQISQVWRIEDNKPINQFCIEPANSTIIMGIRMAISL